MSASLSKTITDLQKAGISLVDSGKINGPKVDTLLGKRFEALPGTTQGDTTPEEGASRPDFLTLQMGLVELVEHELDRLVEIDESHVAELDESREQRAERDAAVAEVRETIAGIRSAWEGVYGAGATLQLFGGVTELPQDPLRLKRLLMRILSRLQSEDFALPPARIEGFSTLDRERLTSALEELLTRLAEALDAVGRERKGSDASLLEKQTAIAEIRRTLRFAGGCLGSLYGLAGLEELAAKVLPRRRATRGSKSEDVGEPASEESTDDGSQDDPSGGDGVDGSPSGPIGIVK